MKSTLTERTREIEIFGSFDVVVVGGGPAGLAAATAAARNGADVLLVERYGFLGGMGTAGGVTNFAGLFGLVHGETRQVIHGVADDFLDRGHCVRYRVLTRQHENCVRLKRQDSAHLGFNLRSSHGCSA